MNTYTPQVHGHHSFSGWSLKHPLVSTIAVIVAAVVAGVLIGVLFSLLFTGTPAAIQHRAGGHAMATVASAQSAAVAAISAVTDSGATATAVRTRTPARGGFAVGRSAGAGEGFFTVPTGKTTGVKGFPGRSIGAGGGGGSLLAIHTGKMTGVNGFPGRAIGAV